MQCRYREKLVVVGDMIFGSVYATYRRAGARCGKFRETSEIQKRNNERRALEYLIWTVHANFGRGDYAVDLTYREDLLPATDEAFERDCRAYLGRIRKAYRLAGAECKYILVRAASESGRYHLHLILSGGIGRDAVESLWGMGRANCDALQFNECGVIDKCRYILGQRKTVLDGGREVLDRAKGKKRWSGSRNLIRPAEKVDDYKYSAKKVREIAESGNPQGIFMREYPGYALAEFPCVERNEVNGGYYMTFVLYKPDGVNLVDYRRRR